LPDNKNTQAGLFPGIEEPTQTDKISALDELFKSSRTYKSSKQYQDLLKFICRFPRLSPFNAFLIHTQNPGVEVVLTKSQWRKYNRQVIHNARPMVILIPFGPVTFVYDVADTEGPAELPIQLTNPFYTIGNLNPKIYYNTIDNCLKNKINVKLNRLVRAAAGQAERHEKHFKIRLNSTWGINEKHSTLVHELGHIFSGHLGVFKNSWWNSRPNLDIKIKEIEAESITYLVCNRLGLETSSHEYLSGYIEKDSELPDISLENILIVSGYIEQMKEKYFKPRKPKKENKKQKTTG